MNVSKFPLKSLKELRFVLNSACPFSKGLVSYLNNNFDQHYNQDQYQFLIRESEGVSPVIIARYGKNYFIT